MSIDYLFKQISLFGLNSLDDLFIKYGETIYLSLVRHLSLKETCVDLFKTTLVVLLTQTETVCLCICVSVTKTLGQLITSKMVWVILNFAQLFLG